MQRICVFCGSSPGTRPEFTEATEGFARLIVERGMTLVYGGAKLGLMGVLADTVLAEGGEAIGVIPSVLTRKEIVHEGLTKLHEVSSMHERKARMAELSDGFVSLPGGLGTWEETFEMLTWAQLGIHDKPCALLNVSGYFTPVVDLFEHALEEGFLRRPYHDMLIVETSGETLLDRMASYEPPARHEWLSAHDA
ncbi:MAG: TIGR00730 family Rossman fold protein [Myxococcota bacterium]